MHPAIEKFRVLLLEAAPLIANAQAVIRYDETTWVVTLSDDVFAEAYVDERLRKITFSMALGQPQLSLRAATYQTLFLINGMWKATNGLRFGLTEPEGDIEMCLDLNLDYLTTQKLAALVQDFTARGQIWQGLMAEHGGLDPESAPLSDNEMRAEHIIHA